MKKIILSLFFVFILIGNVFAGSSTINLGLYMPTPGPEGHPEQGEMWWGGKLNNNSIIIDTVLGSLGINVLDPQYDVTGLGIVDDSTAIGVVDTAANGKTLIFPSGTYKISNNLTITSPVIMLGKAKFSIDSGKVITINGSFHAGLYQVFSGSGTVTFGSIKEAYPEWWESTDFGLALQSAINAASKIVIVSGTHTFTVAHYSPGDTTHPLGVYLKDNLHIIIEKGATVTQANSLQLQVFFGGHFAGTGVGVPLTNVTIEVYGMIDGNYVNQTYPANSDFQACPIALFATKSNFPIVRAKNFGRYGALVLYYGPHLNVGDVYAENSYDSSYYQAKALDLETVDHANVKSVMGDNLQGAIVDLPDGGSFINIDSINGKDSYSILQMIPHAYTLGLHDIQIGKVIGEGHLVGGGFHGIVIEAYDNRVEPKDISFGQVSISDANLDGIRMVTGTPTTARVRRIQFGNVILHNNGQNNGSGSGGNGLSLGYCNDIKIGSLITYDDQTPKTQYYGVSFAANATHVTVNMGDITASGLVADVFGYDPTNHHLLDVVGWKTENSGTSAAISTGQTIAHGLVATPDFINITPIDTGLTDIHATADGTNITVTFSGAGSHAFYWYARTARNN